LSELGFHRLKDLADFKNQINPKIYKQNKSPNADIGVFNTIKNGYLLQNLVSFNSNLRDGPAFNHPTIKPLELITYLIEVLSNQDDLVFDGFAGSGTTAIACIKTNRRFIGCELDKEYFDLSCKRIDNELLQGRLF